MNILRNFRLALVTLSLAAASASIIAPAGAQEVGSPEFDAAVQRFIENNPQVILNSINKFVAEQQALQAAAANEQYLGYSDAFFQGDLPTIGNPEGTVTLAYILDAACAYCRRMAPVIEEIIQDNPDVRIVQRWVPFLTPASEYAGRVATLIWKRHPDKYKDFYHALMIKSVPLTNDVVNSVIEETFGAEGAAIIIADVAGEVDGPALAKAVAENLELVTLADVAGTPFIHVRGTKSEGIFRGAVPTETLQQAIDLARSAN